MNRIIAILLTVQMVWSLMPATALAGQGKGLEKTAGTKTAGSPYKPVDPAAAGRYTITLEPKGKGLADFYSLDVIVVDASGKRYNEDFYTVVDDRSSPVRD